MVVLENGRRRGHGILVEEKLGYTIYGSNGVFNGSIWILSNEMPQKSVVTCVCARDTPGFAARSEFHEIIISLDGVKDVVYSSMESHLDGSRLSSKSLIIIHHYLNH